MDKRIVATFTGRFVLRDSYSSRLRFVLNIERIDDLKVTPNRTSPALGLHMDGFGVYQVLMSCLSCGSGNEAEFAAEMVMHFSFSGLKNLDKPCVWIFPKLLVCLDCGFS
jgi:hypothetical protein